MSRNDSFSAVVVGAGPAGLATALALSQSGLNTALAGPPANAADARTAALFQSSVQFLRNIRVWDAIAPQAEPIRTMRLADATGGLVRAPEVSFHASEIGLEAFGYNVPTGALSAALEEAAAPRLTRIFTNGVDRLEWTDAGIALTLAEGSAIAAKLVAAADGRNSLCRRDAGIDTKNWSYPQSAVVTTFSHTRPHGGVSTELHRRTGPLTIVPMSGNVSSLVWVETPEEAQRLAALSEADFVAALEPYVAHLIGSLSNLTPRRVFPLSGQTASVLAKNRVALIGEAGHVIPPIGAQGLNLSLRDAATLAELAGEAQLAGADPGAPALLETYEARRRADIGARVWTIDLMNRSLLSEFPPIHFARGFGLAALKVIAPLRHLVMREGVTPSFATPRLMQEPSTP